MYAERVGDRWQGMNPFGSLARAGVVLAFGSDSPVTELGGWEAVRAAAFHHEQSEADHCAGRVRGAHPRRLASGRDR